ncbi:MAG TPA: GNAT family N-acetyltransferase, partial [bacterium]|nr:GNAT family N-acetyltransferase [bacterium]
MSNQTIVIRDAMSSEFSLVGQLMVEVYAGLKGFPKPTEQPAYYKMLSAVGELTLKPDTALRVAVLNDGTIAGAVVYFGDMQYYGSGGTATQEKNSAGFRLLAVNPEFRGGGIGK